MNNENKELMLDTLRLASGQIDKVTFYYVAAGIGVLWSLTPDVTWTVAADGKLTMTGTLDFENTTSLTISPIGFCLLNSSATALVDTDDAVSIYALPGGSVSLDPGEIIRISSMTYTVD